MFHSRPLVGRGKLDAAGVTVGYLELALVTRVAIDGENKWITLFFLHEILKLETNMLDAQTGGLRNC